MTEAATAPKVQRVTIPWTLFEGLPEVPRDPTAFPVSLLRPTIPVLLRGPAGFAQENCLLDTGSDESIFHVRIAHELGFDPNECSVGRVQFMGEDGPEPVYGFENGLSGLVAERWLMALPARFKDYPPYFFEAGLLGRDVLNHFRVTYDGPARATTLELDGEENE